MKTALFITLIFILVFCLIMIATNVLPLLWENKIINVPNEFIVKIITGWKKHCISSITISTSCFVFSMLLLVYGVDSRTVAVYKESKYDIEALAEELAIKAALDEKYSVRYHDLTSDYKEKTIKIDHYIHSDKYIIEMYGIDEIPTNKEFIDISDKYKKE